VRLSSGLSMASATAVTVTVFGVLQSVVVKTRLAGETVATLASALLTATVTVPAAGREPSTTV